MSEDEASAPAEDRVANAPERPPSATERRTGATRRRRASIAAGVALAVACVLTSGVIATALRGPATSEGSGDERLGSPPVEGRDADPATAANPTAEDPPPSVSTEVEPQAWIDSLPTGAPPLTPYFHDGILHVAGEEIQTSFAVEPIVVAGATVMVGGDRENGPPTTWWKVEGDKLVFLFPYEGYYPALSVDGRIAFWQRRGLDTTTFVTWDVAANRELATHSVSGSFGFGNRLQMLGIDADGIAYWVDQSSDPPVTRWDLRTGVVEPLDVAWDFSRTFEDQPEPIPRVFLGQEDSYVSPDGAREIFTESLASDSPQDCCAARLRVRSVGNPYSSITTLQLPESVPGQPLWNSYTDRGSQAWWETDETVLLVAGVGSQAYLIRCWATGGACERVLDLGPRTEGALPAAWEENWSFAEFPPRG